MARVLFIVPMDVERRAALARKETGAFEPVILEDLPPEKRDAAWATADVVVSMDFPPGSRLNSGGRPGKGRRFRRPSAGWALFPLGGFPRPPCVGSIAAGKCIPS